MNVRAHVLWSLILVLAQPVWGETQSPRIACDAAEFDFGAREDTEVVEHEFVLRNAGTAALVIERVRATCGCAFVNLSSERIEPGARATLQLRYDLRGRSGLQHKSIGIDSNDPVEPTYRLWIKGTALTPIGLKPDYVAFGKLSPHSATGCEVRVESRRPGAGMTGLRCDSKQLAVEEIRQDGGRPSAFVVRTVPPLEPGYLQGTVTVSTDYPKKPVLKLIVSALVEGEVRVIPREMVLRGLQGGTVKRTLFIRPGRVSAYRVLEVVSPVPGVDVQVSAQGGGGYRIDVLNLPVSVDLNGKSFRVITDLGEMQTIDVPVRVIP